MAQAKIDVDVEKTKELIDRAPLNSLPSKVIRQLDALLCTVTLGKHRITQYVPVPAPVIDAKMFADEDNAILRAFTTYPCGRKAIKKFESATAVVQQELQTLTEIEKHMESCIAICKEPKSNVKSIATHLTIFSEYIMKMKADAVERMSQQDSVKVREFVFDILDQIFTKFVEWLWLIFDDEDGVAEYLMCGTISSPEEATTATPYTDLFDGLEILLRDFHILRDVRWFPTDQKDVLATIEYALTYLAAPEKVRAILARKGDEAVAAHIHQLFSASQSKKKLAYIDEETILQLDTFNVKVLAHQGLADILRTDLCSGIEEHIGAIKAAVVKEFQSAAKTSETPL